MATVEQVVVKIGADISEFSRNMQNATNELSNIGQRAQNMGSQIATSFGGFSLAVGGALGFSVKKAADFDTAMRKAGAIAGATTEDFDAMKQAALDLGASTSLSATEVADAMTNLAAAGFDANQTIEAMPGIISAAEASGEDLAMVSDTVASALNAFGLEAGEASRVADILAETANSTAAGVGDMQYAFKYAAPVFSSLGLSMEELAASTGLLTNAGMAGEQAGTTLRAAMLRLVDPPKAAANVMEDLGFSAIDAGGKMKSIAQISGELGESMEGMTEAQKAAALATIFGTEAVSGMLTLINAGPATINEMTKSLENSEGASAAAAEQMKAGIGGAIDEMTGAFETLAIVIGDTLVPYVQKAALWLGDLASKLANMPKPLREFLVVGTALSAIFAGIIAVVGVFITIIGNVITAVAAIKGAFASAIGWVGKLMQKFQPAAGQVGILTRATGLLANAFKFLTGPIGWVITAVIALVDVFRRLYKGHEDFRNLTTGIWESITGKVSAAAAAIGNAFGPNIEKVKNALAPLGEAFGNLFSKIGGWFSSTGNSMFQRFGDAVTNTIEVVKGAFSSVYPYLEKFGSWNFGKLTEALGLISDYIVGFIETTTQLINGDWAGAWQTARETVVNALSGFGKLYATAFEEAKAAIATKMGEIRADISTKMTEIRTDIATQIGEWALAISTKFVEIRTDIATKLAEWGTTISDWFTNMPTTITTQLGLWGAAMREWAMAQNEENKRQFGEWGTAIGEWFTSIPEKFTVWFAGWGASITNWFVTTKESIRTNISEWGTAIGEWFASIPEKITVWFAGWFASITNWFTTTKQNIGTKLGEWGTSISTWFSEMPGKISTSLANWWSTMSTWFSEVPGKISAKLEEWWTAIRTWFTNLPQKPEIKNAGKNMVDKLSEGNKEKQPDFMSKLGKLIVDVALGALAFAGIALIAAGREIIERLIDGVIALKNWAKEKLGEVVSAMVSAISEIDWLQKGKNIVNGIIDGIKSVSLGGVASWIGGKISDGVDGFFQMKSPSKLMEDKGRNVILGMINGITGMKSSIQRTVDSVAALMQPELDPIAVAGYDMPQLDGVRGTIEANMRGMEDDLEDQGKYPAQIHLRLGANEYETFVDDITETQERKNYKMKIFKRK